MAEKNFSLILDKNLPPPRSASVDSLILVETTFNGEQFNLEHFLTSARNIFVNNWVFSIPAELAPRLVSC